MLLAKVKLRPAAAAALVSKMMGVAARAVKEGYDTKRGGVYEAGVPGLAAGEGEGASTEKVGGRLVFGV
jgi:hypothetical protein